MPCLLDWHSEGDMAGGDKKSDNKSSVEVRVPRPTRDNQTVRTPPQESYSIGSEYKDRGPVQVSNTIPAPPPKKEK